MPLPPQPFSSDTYVTWHEATFPADAPLLDNLGRLRTTLVANSRDQLLTLVQVLVYAANYSRNEYHQTGKMGADYQIPLSDAFATNVVSPVYDLVFKSTASIINKLWRKKNNDHPDVHLGNVQERLTDLVRTDISATTLDSAAFLTRRMNALPGIINEAKVRKAFNNSIASIKFAPEMKMESGYFADHGLVRFKSGLIVEVQIYSDLMRQWRKLSHHLSERARTEGTQQHEFNSKESRLISLGHLLHLAECHLEQLGREFGAG